MRMPLSALGHAVSFAALVATLSLGLSIATSTAAHANAPAPWWACEGKAAGDECSPYGGGSGTCVAKETCTDDAETDVNECLECVGTSGGDDGGGCSAASADRAPLAAPILILLTGAAVLRARDKMSRLLRPPVHPR